MHSYSRHYIDVSGQLHLKGKSPRYPLGKRLSGPRRRSSRGTYLLTPWCKILF